MKKTVLCVCVILIGNTVSATERADDVRLTLQDCAQALSASDRGEAGIIAERLSKMASLAHSTGELSGDLLNLLASEKAEACLSYARQANLEFSAELGTFISASVRQAAEQEKREAELEAERERQQQDAVAAQQLLEMTIDSRVYAA